jgi:N,N'-diacetylchitobiose phosphorylase
MTPVEGTASRSRGEPARFRNGHGGFSPDGTEYVIRLPYREGSGLLYPPQPWINVIANEEFGFLVSETGAGSTWCLNSREHRLTPWSNDPVTDPHGEAFFLRDDETMEFWSPLPGPAPRRADYEIRHGFGYTLCEMADAGIEHETLLFASRRDPLKVIRVRLRNLGGHSRHLSFFAFYQLVLGGLSEEGGRFVVTEPVPERGLILARNRMAGEFAGRVAFAAIVASRDAGRVRLCGDRAAFVGIGGDHRNPAALSDPSPLAGTFGAGLDPCFAQQLSFELTAGESLDLCLLFGEGSAPERVNEILARHDTCAAVERAYEEARGFWRGFLGAVQIHSPSPALDLMVNGWLPYQTLSCRLWARSAFYQSGGAFGFRDQLQDSLALVHQQQEITRGQILAHAAEQFVEGDVLHWWHPPTGKGIRTRFADDLLWLPLATGSYVSTTGDWAILDCMIPFRSARPLEPGEDEAFLFPETSGDAADLYEHCCRALDRSLNTGEHGLPLFGTGDWNDAMNRVGRLGKGESVWMGFFLYAVLGEFLPICSRRSDTGRVARYEQHREMLRKALEENGWDGEWYRRGYYDDGTPLGSDRDEECRIDALAQSWAVLSGAAPPDRARRAIEAVERRLVSEKDGLIRLLAPPFDRTPKDPGYIKGYAPGIRENGGQYTHAALWFVRALCEMGRRDRAAALLEMLNPITHARTPEEVSVYCVEPYVIAADVYGEPPHTGRGGWSWYTGSSGWMYRVALESVLGFTLRSGEWIVMKPRIPDSWDRAGIVFTPPQGETVYEIEIRNPNGCAESILSATIDGVTAPVTGGEVQIPLVPGRGRCRVIVTLGRREELLS